MRWSKKDPKGSKSEQFVNSCALCMRDLRVGDLVIALHTGSTDVMCPQCGTAHQANATLEPDGSARMIESQVGV
jgi:uncharacterized Zn finger protein